MDVKARFTFTRESMRELVHFSMFKKADPKKRMITWSIIYAVLMLIVILTMGLIPDSQGWYYLLVIGLVLLLEYYLYFVFPVLQYNALGKLKETVNDYTFNDDTMKVSSQNPVYAGESELQYDMFWKAYETSKNFFLYQTKNQVFVVDKSTITGGTAEDIRSKLSEALKEKYIICRY